MIKSILRGVLESLGYSVRRINPPPAPPAPVRCVPLKTVRVDLFPNLPVELDLSDEVQRHALCSGINYESPSPQLLRSFCGPPGTMFFDMGANFGYYSYYMLAHCPHVRVHSFEPNPALVRGQRIVAAESCAGRYFPHQLGLSDDHRELVLTVSSLNTGWSTFGPNPDFKGLEDTLSTHRVPVTTFDAWRAAQSLPLPSTPSWVVKMDIEGYEPNALRGMGEALRAHAFKALLIELLDHTLNFCGGSAGEVFTLMDRAGYAPFDVWLQPTTRQAKEERNVLFLPKA